MDNERCGVVKDAWDIGYMSKEAYDQACYSLVERCQSNDINGMSMRFRGEVRVASWFLTRVSVITINLNGDMNSWVLYAGRKQISQYYTSSALKVFTAERRKRSREQPGFGRRRTSDYCRRRGPGECCHVKAHSYPI